MARLLPWEDVDKLSPYKDDRLDVALLMEDRSGHTGRQAQLGLQPSKPHQDDRLEEALLNLQRGGNSDVHQLQDFDLDWLPVFGSLAAEGHSVPASSFGSAIDAARLVPWQDPGRLPAFRDDALDAELFQISRIEEAAAKGLDGNGEAPLPLLHDFEVPELGSFAAGRASLAGVSFSSMFDIDLLPPWVDHEALPLWRVDDRLEDELLRD
eukprot:2413627-Pleurochrysis_carterae.AAC.1